MRIVLFFLLLISTKLIAVSSVYYTVSMPEPQTHYFEVSMRLSGVSGNEQNLKMPVWTPGSYLVREFARNLEGFQAVDLKGNALVWEKTDKNTFKVNTKGLKEFEVRYLIYANELSVRTSFVNAEHAAINGASLFLYLDKALAAPCTLKVNPYKDWKKVSTSLDKINGAAFEYFAPDYDILVDSPLEIGNHLTFEFAAGGITHEVAMYGSGNFNVDSLKKDMANVVEQVIAVIGENPNKKYTFIIHNLTIPSGGLEHLSSTTLQVNRFTYEPRSAYLSFLALVAHEYFHLFNVKRIRPYALGPFHYDKENYTHMLWISEGFTSYYEELLLLRAGYKKPQEYLDYLGLTLNAVENQPGNDVQSAAESSFDAWIKGYRPNENSYNSTISYYGKGETIAVMLDVLIVDATSGNKNLDDLMRYLYKEYYQKRKRGFTNQEFNEALDLVAGKSISPFIQEHVFSTKQVDYAAVFSKAGVNCKLAIAEPGKVSLGANLSENAGRLMVKSVTRNTSAYLSGLNADDEILAVDNYRVNSDKLTKYLAFKKPGDQLSFLISRDDKIQSLSITLKENPTVRHTLTLNDQSNDVQKRVRTKWLNLK